MKYISYLQLSKVHLSILKDKIEVFNLLMLRQVEQIEHHHIDRALENGASHKTLQLLSVYSSSNYFLQFVEVYEDFL